MTQSRQVILYIATSLDGIIAQPHDDLSFLSMVEQPGEDYGYNPFVETVDTVIMGRRTYDKVLSMGMGFPHADKTSYIITRAPRPSEGSVHFYTGSLTALVHMLQSKPGKNIYCDGGAEIAQALLQDQLIEELIISVVPVLLGEGTRLFRDGLPLQSFELVSVKSFEKGLVQLHYRKSKTRTTS
jgi:dihydrofolate reductase